MVNSSSPATGSTPRAEHGAVGFEQDRAHGIVGDGVAQFAQQILAHRRVQQIAFFQRRQRDAAQAPVLFDAQVHRSLHNQMLAMAVGAGGVERECQNAPRRQRIDQRVHVTARGGVARVQPAFVIRAGLRHALFELRRNRRAAGFQFFELRTVHRLHRGVALHHADARRGPGEGEVRIEALAGHRVVTRAARVIQGQDDFGHSGAGHGSPPSPRPRE